MARQLVFGLGLAFAFLAFGPANAQARWEMTTDPSLDTEADARPAFGAIRAG